MTQHGREQNQLDQDRPPLLAAADRDALLALARQTVSAVANGTPLPERPGNGSAAIDSLQGAFVTLHQHGSLRGCVGIIEGIKPLWRSVRDAAVSASTRDPRFPAVQPEEVANLHIEISALSPLQPVRSLDDIVVGTHGLLVDNGRHSGLLLPQVPLEWGWDRDTFVRHTLRKAGLPPDALEDPALELFIFSADIFSEPEPDDPPAAG